MKPRRILLVLVLVADVLIVLALWPRLRGPTRRVDDRVGLIPDHEELQFNHYLDWVRNESGIDIRIVLAPDSRGTTPDQFALATMRELGIGRETGARGVLILYDTLARAMRVEVGPRLEGILPDAFAGYLMREHLAAFFDSGQPELGLRTTLFMIHWRIRMARLGEEYDPSFEEYMRDVRRVAAGGGASGRMPSGGGTARFINRSGDTTAAGHFRPQRSVEAAYRLQEEWLALGGGQVDVPLFTPRSREYLRNLPMSPAFNGYLLASQYGRRYVVDERGDLAMLYYTDDPFLSPKFFRRGPEGWQVDIIAEVANSQEAAGMWYTWQLRVSGDDFSRVFADLYTPMLIPGMDDFYRVAGGDNRALTIRGTSKEVESELDSHRRAGAESLTDGVPGVEYLTVRQAAERIRAARGRPAVVLLYGIWNEQTLRQLPEIVRLAHACRRHGIEFLAFHTDHMPRAVEALPDTLRRYDAPFPTVQLYRWRSGMLNSTLAELDLRVGSSWEPPLAAVLDRRGAVVWQAQGVTDWSGVEKVALTAANGAR
ncbi:MAG TPA: TPM domain-containing protein [Gemmatimonadales bacterium]|nr:TPM domain-containing protein [Gemmatimonadales bacterium]